MPQKNFSGSIATGASNDNIFSNWQYQYLPWPARLKLLIRSPNGATVTPPGLVTVTSGSETIAEESPVQAGGTPGVTPAELNTAPVVWDAARSDFIKVKVRNTDTAAVVFDAIIYAFPH